MIGLEVGALNPDVISAIVLNVPASSILFAWSIFAMSGKSLRDNSDDSNLSTASVAFNADSSSSIGLFNTILSFGMMNMFSSSITAFIALIMSISLNAVVSFFLLYLPVAITVSLFWNLSLVNDPP